MKKTSARKKSGPATAMLKQDHRKVEDLFRRFDQAHDFGRKRRIFEEVARELKVHTALEEEIFYPEARDVTGNLELVDEAIQEHHVVDMLLAELAGMDPSDAEGEQEFAAKFKVLRENVEHHIGEEEDELFPETEASGLDSESVAERMAERKSVLEEEI